MITIRYLKIIDKFIIEKDKKSWDLDISQDQQGLTIKNSHFVCPPFFIKDTDGYTIISTNHKLKLNDEFVFSPDLNISHQMWSVNNKSIKMLNAPEKPFDLPYDMITNYSEIRILKGKNVKIIKKENDLSKVYSVPLEDSKDLIKQWSEKYLDIVSDLCKQDKFIPTLTGGCDTRILTYFWRKHNIKNYRLRAVKQDGKNNIKKGEIEIDIAQKILKKLGMNCERLEELPQGASTMSGRYTENNREPLTHNNVLFVKNIINKCCRGFLLYPHL